MCIPAKASVEYRNFLFAAKQQLSLNFEVLDTAVYLG